MAARSIRRKAASNFNFINCYLAGEVYKDLKGVFKYRIDMAEVYSGTWFMKQDKFARYVIAYFLMEIKTPVKTSAPPVICHRVICSPKKITAVTTPITGIRFKKLAVSPASRC